MKKILVALSLLALVGCDDASGGGKLAITKHENGKIASRGYIIPTAGRHPNAAGIEPIKVGEWVYFYEDGQKEKQGTYLEDQMHGSWQFWLPGDSESWTSEYTNGEGSKNGRFTLTSEDVRDRFDQALKASGASPKQISMMSQMERPQRAEGFYRFGKEHGVWTHWHKNGQKASENTFRDGKEEGVSRGWHENGQKAYESHLDGGKRVGVATHWHENGQKFLEDTYQDGKREGVSTIWYENGQKMVEGTYSAGEKEGVSTYWDTQGNVTKTETYKNGELVK